MLDHLERPSAPTALRYCAAIALFGCAFWVRYGLFPQDSRLSYSTFYPAVFLALYFLGLGPGLLATALSVVAGYYFFLTPFHSWHVTTEGFVAAGNFLFTSLMAALMVTQLRRQRAGAQRTARELRNVYDQSPCAYFSLDGEGRFLQVNAMALRWLGAEERALVGKAALRDFLQGEDIALFEAAFARCRSRGTLGPLLLDLIPRSGAPRGVSLSAVCEIDEEANTCRNRSVMYDVSELETVRQRLETLTRQQNAMLDNDLVGIMRLKDRSIVWTNRAVERIFGYPPGELVGKPVRIFYANDADYDAFGATAYEALRQGRHFRAQLPLMRKDTQPIWVDVSGIILDETGESMWMSLDITEMKRYQQQVEKIAFHDSLTGLPNRALLADRLQQAVSTARRLDRMTAVCFVDLDGFKAINDHFGHAAGDLALQTIARRLLDCVRAHDTVARLGGDEFILLLTNLERRAECEAVIERVTKEVALPIPLNGAIGRLTASIGVAFGPDEGADGERLVALADERMYREKELRQGKAQPDAAPN